MAAPTLPLQDKISQASSGGTKYRINSMQFGDGYSQRVPDGINYIVKNWTIMYDNIDATDMTTLQTFCDTVGGHAYFTWQPPGIQYSVALKWIITGEMRVSVRSGGVYSVSFPVMQVFDLGS